MIIKKMFESGRLLLLFSFLVIAGSCGDGNKSAEESEESGAVDENEVIAMDIHKIAEELPSPTEVPQNIERIGAAYHPEIINELEKMTSYLSDQDKASLNLGVYAADISYLIAYDRVDESVEHVEACLELSNFLGVKTAFSEELVQNYRAAAGNHEKLVELLNKSILDMDYQLEESDDLKNAALVLTGSFVEGLYIALGVVKTYHSNKFNKSEKDKMLEPLLKLVLAQEKALEDVIQMLKDVPFDDTVALMITELGILKNLFKGDLQLIKESIENNPDFVITEDTLFDIEVEVNRIRGDIVG
jgi:soluble cytochrome b562